MAYYLTINRNQRILDISSLEEFRRLSKFKNSSYSLEEIDLFSTAYNNEIELKQKLYESGIISQDEITKKLEIRMRYDGKLEKVTYDLAYSYNKKFLNTDYLKHQFLILQNDVVFLKKLLNKYNTKRNIQEEIFAIRAIVQSYENYGRNVYDDLSIYNNLNSFFNKIIYDQTGKIQYKALHDLAMFVYNYLLNKTLGEINVKSMEETTRLELEKLKESYLPKKEKVDLKVKVKSKKYDLDGQQSLF